jgi:hypothetical protein
MAKRRLRNGCAVRHALLARLSTTLRRQDLQPQTRSWRHRLRCHLRGTKRHISTFIIADKRRLLVLSKNALFEQFIYKHDHFAKTASATNVRKVEKLSAPPLPQPPLCLSPIPCHLQTPIPFSKVSCPDMIASVMCD